MTTVKAGDGAPVLCPNAKAAGEAPNLTVAGSIPAGRAISPLASCPVVGRVYPSLRDRAPSGNDFETIYGRCVLSTAGHSYLEEEKNAKSIATR